jgi:hypothetical protein
MYCAKRQVNMITNQNKNTDSAITSKAMKSCAVKRRTSAMFSVIFFLHDICVPFKIMVSFRFGRLYNVLLSKRNTPSKRVCAEKFPDFFKYFLRCEEKGGL